MKLIAQGRRRAGARHAARPVRHAAAARPRLLAEEREDHPDRQRPPHARPGEADLGRHLSATPRRRRRRSPTASPTASLPHAAQPGRAREDDQAEKEAWEKELDGWTHEKDAWSLEVAKGSPTCIRARCCASSRRPCRQNAMVSTDIGNICSVSNSLSALRAAELDVRRHELRQLRLRASRPSSAPRWPRPTARPSPMSATAPGA